MQNEFFIDGSYGQIKEYLSGKGTLFVVCDGSYGFLKISKAIDSLGDIVKFSDFKPNPDYQSVEKAVELFNAKGCKTIVAVGGGSAIDVAKCVKLYANAKAGKCYLEQDVEPADIELVAVPTTAGTGSEATRYAVIYKDGVKQSISHVKCIPDTVVFDPSALETLPDYQRKATMLDALCHAVESFWSVNSSDESKEFSKQALALIFENANKYISGDKNANKAMMRAANVAGKAIDITQTTAGHAMCYKLTSLYSIAHGHAAALCVNRLMPYMLSHTADCADGRGKDYLDDMFTQLAKSMGCKSTDEMCEKFSLLLGSLNLKTPKPADGDIDELVKSVNPTRLKNNPVALDDKAIRKLYKEILE